MCDVLDKVENRGIEKGIVKGESRGCLLYTSDAADDDTIV